MLEDRAKRLGVAGSVIFHDRFVSQAELSEFLAAADIYITPYLNPEQISSGTLAYALGAGKAVISTPYAYATELLADGRGILVPWKDAGAIATEIVGLFDEPARRLAMRQRAAAHGRAMLWPAVAKSYLQSFENAVTEHARKLHTAFRGGTLATRWEGAVGSRHRRRLLDGSGAAEPRWGAVSRGASRRFGVHQPPRLGLRFARNRAVPPCIRGGSERPGNRAGDLPPAPRAVSPHQRSRVAMV